MLETALTPTLEQTLNLIISSLANFFGTTTEKIMENAPYWLAKYGWYKTIYNRLPEALLAGFLIGTLLMMGFFMICETMFDLRVKNLKIIIIGVIIFTITILIIIGVPLISCAIAPEIVGLESVIKLLK